MFRNNYIFQKKCQKISFLKYYDKCQGIHKKLIVAAQLKKKRLKPFY